MSDPTPPRSLARPAIAIVVAAALAGGGFALGRLGAGDSDDAATTTSAVSAPMSSTTIPAETAASTTTAPTVADTVVPVDVGEVPTDGASLVTEAGPGALTDVPDGAVRVGPDEDLVSVVENSPQNTVFVIEPGVHRLRGEIRPKAGMQFLGEPDSVLSGAELVQGWTTDGATWRATVEPVIRTGTSGMCEVDSELACTYPEDLYLDDVLQRRVLDSADVEPGTWYLDDAGTIVVGSDPTGARAEFSREGYAFATDAATETASVVIHNLTIEKFGTQAQRAAVGAEDSNGGWQQAADPATDPSGGWTITNNLVRWNHAGGIYAGTGSLVARNIVVDNGQVGIKAAGSGARIEHNEVARNNTIGFQRLWEAGGLKFWNARNLTVTGNWIHHNDGSGLWADYAREGMVVSGNVAEANTDSGINIEMTIGTQVVGNLVIGNDIGDRDNPGYWSGGIFLYNTPLAQVRGNVLRDNVGGVIVQVQERGCIDPVETQGAGLCLGDAPSGTTTGVVVEGNDITMTEGVTGMIVIASSDFPPYAEQPASFAEAAYAEPAARFVGNLYRGTGYESDDGPDDQYTDPTRRFVWGFPHGFESDPDNIYSYTSRRYLGFDDWVRYARPDGDRLEA